MTSLYFTNTSDEDFICVYGKVPYSIKAGKTIMVPDYLALHFAKHFVDRELNKMKLPTDSSLRGDMIAKCVSATDISAPDEVSLAAQINNPSLKVETVATPAPQKTETVKAPWCDSCDSKGVKHKKECPKNKKEVFEGLK